MMLGMTLVNVRLQNLIFFWIALVIYSTYVHEHAVDFLSACSPVLSWLGTQSTHRVQQLNLGRCGGVSLKMWVQQSSWSGPSALYNVLFMSKCYQILHVENVENLSS